jgi:hypothetical protein
MGSIRRVIKKVTRAVKKPVSKAFKGVAKGIMKVGKATMRGIAKINKKLGPLGSVALAIAMPYALSGLSTGTTALMNSQNAFLRSIGTIGNQIRTGYQAFNTGVSKTFNTITKSISQGFKKFAPKNIQNTYKSISEGAKNLFNSAKRVTQKYSPIKGKQGTVEVFGTADPGVSIVSSTDAARAIEAGTLDVSQIGKQTLGSDKWFVQGSKQTDKIITDTINDAYKSTLDTFSPDAKRYFNDLKSRASDIKTYVNDAEIGSAVENSVASSKYGTADGLDVIDVDLMKTGDYSSLNEEGTEFLFNGNKTYSADPVKDASSKLGKTVKQSAFKYAKGLLKPSDEKISPYTIAANQDMTMQTSTGSYGGTDITGTAGGDFFTKVYGEDAGRRIKNYYKNMNLIGSMTI